MTESALLRDIRIYASRLGWTLWRNNTGKAKQGPRTVRYGLCVGSADLIGFRTFPVRWSPSLCARVAQFVAIEVKTGKGRVSPAQQNFIDHVNRSGGLGIIARSLHDIHD